MLKGHFCQSVTVLNLKFQLYDIEVGTIQPFYVTKVTELPF